MCAAHRWRWGGSLRGIRKWCRTQKHRRCTGDAAGPARPLPRLQYVLTNIFHHFTIDPPLFYEAWSRSTGMSEFFFYCHSFDDHLMLVCGLPPRVITNWWLVSGLTSLVATSMLRNCRMRTNRRHFIKELSEISVAVPSLCPSLKGCMCCRWWVPLLWAS